MNPLVDITTLDNVQSYKFGEIKSALPEVVTNGDSRKLDDEIKGSETSSHLIHTPGRSPDSYRPPLHN